MAKGVSFELTGLRDLQSLLENASAQTRAAVAKVNEDTAYAVQARARANAPKDRGDLARAIQVSGKGMTWRVGLQDARISSRGGRNSAHLNPSVYGVWIEYGTRYYSKHPFMRPAADAEQARYETRVDAAARGLTSTFGQAA